MKIEEEWRDIKGYENLYRVSNKGQVKSLGNGKSNASKEKILKPSNSNNYLKVRLCKDGEIKSLFVHRLVANAFIPNPNNLPCVNHKDENPSNNCVENLEFSSYQYNNIYGTRLERVSKSNSIKLKNNPKISTQIKCVNMKTNDIIVFPSIMEAARFFNVCSSPIWYSLYKSKKPFKKQYIFSEINK